MPEDHVGASWATELANISQQPVLRQVSRHKITQLAGLSDLCRSWGLLTAILNHVNIQVGRHLWKSLAQLQFTASYSRLCPAKFWVSPRSSKAPLGLSSSIRPLWRWIYFHLTCKWNFSCYSLWPLPLSFHCDLLKILHFLYKLAWNKSLQLRQVLIFALNSQDTLGFPKFHVR